MHTALSNRVAIAVLTFATLLADRTLAQELPQGATTRLGKHGEGIGFGGMYRLAFSPDGKLLAGRGSDQIVRVWELATGKERFAVEAHEDRVLVIEFTPDGKQLITASPGVRERIKFWDIETSKEARSIAGQAMVLRTDDDGKAYTAVTSNQYARLAADDGKELARVSFSAARRTTALSPDGLLTAEVSDAMAKAQNAIITIRSTHDWAAKAQLKGLTASPVASAFSPDGRTFVASGRRQPYFYMWRLDGTNKPEQPTEGTMLKGHSGQIQAFAFSADGRHLATASWDHTIRLWEVLTGKEIATFSGHDEHVVSVAFSNDGKQLASGAAGRTDASAIVWNVDEMFFGSAGTSDDQLSDEELSKNWKNLGQEVPGGAYDAIASLRRHPKQALKLFADKLGPVLKPTSGNDVAELIKQLDADSYKEREEATQKLIKLRTLAEAALQKELKTTESAEVRYRIRLILETPPAKSTLSPVDRRTTFRLIYVLELIGSDDAKSQVAALSTGHADVNVLREATAALERLGGAK
ncbi:MAG: hypothetical protein MI757_01540 [Pirellulales bacterium]|nr:hypothetical protein [Pirellulales bacterium]